MCRIRIFMGSATDRSKVPLKIGCKPGETSWINQSSELDSKSMTSNSSTW